MPWKHWARRHWKSSLKETQVSVHVSWLHPGASLLTVFYTHYAIFSSLGLAKKRAMLGVGASPSLSQLLLEAKAEASARAAQREGGMEESSTGPLNYSRLFEEYNGELQATMSLANMSHCCCVSRCRAPGGSRATIQRVCCKGGCGTTC